MTRPAKLLSIGGALAALLALQAVFFTAGPARLSCAALAAEEQPPVVLFGTSWCTLCKKSRWFLEDHDIAYCEYDIETSAQGAERYRALDGRGTPPGGIPLIVIGSERIVGYNPPALLSALRRQGLLSE